MVKCCLLKIATIAGTLSYPYMPILWQDLSGFFAFGVHLLLAKEERMEIYQPSPSLSFQEETMKSSGKCVAGFVWLQLQLLLFSLLQPANAFCV